jgi:hypothetical protein
LLLAGTALSACGTSSYQESDKEQAYNTTRTQIQSAVISYEMAYNGGLPPISGNYTIITKTRPLTQYPPEGNWSYAGYYTTTVSAIDLCLIIELAQDESWGKIWGTWLTSVPDGCYGTSGQAGTNFFSGSCNNPKSGHYIWVIHDTDQVFSICDENQDGTYSDTDRVDGFHQDIWP